MRLTGEVTVKKMNASLAAALIAASGALAATAHAAGPVGEITHLSGLLTTKRADGSSRVFAVRSQVQEGDTLSTEQETYARIKFSDGSEVVLRPGSQMKVSAFSFDKEKPENDNVLISMFKGGLRAVTGLIGKRNRDAVNFATTTATIGIRGTHFGALICNNDCGSVPTASGNPPPNGLHVDVTDGAVVVKNDAGQQQLNSGQFGYVSSAKSAPAVAPSQEGIKVTMPIAISQNTAAKGLGKSGGSECAVQ
jgi:hypothetical protein